LFSFSRHRCGPQLREEKLFLPPSLRRESRAVCRSPPPPSHGLQVAYRNDRCGGGPRSLLPSGAMMKGIAFFFLFSSSSSRRHRILPVAMAGLRRRFLGFLSFKYERDPLCLLVKDSSSQTKAASLSAFFSFSGLAAIRACGDKR